MTELREDKIYLLRAGLVFISLLIVLFIGYDLHAQVNGILSQGPSAQDIDVSFTVKEVQINKGQIISNVLKIINNSDDSIAIKIKLNFPPTWKTLFNSDKLYSLNSKDSIFIPVRIIPDMFMKGNTKYYINAFLENESGKQLTNDYFFAFTEIINRWEMSVLPSNRIYFRNNESDTKFSLNLFNSGNEQQDIFLTMSIPQSNIVLMDTNERVLKENKYDVTLKSLTDTTFDFKLRYIEGERNFKNIDIENYNPSIFDEEKRFSIFFNSAEPRRFGTNRITRNEKVDFVKLSNTKKVNPYGSNVLPLTAYFRVSNLLDDIIFSSLHLRGSKYFSNGGNLIYNASLYFSSQENFYNRENFLRDIPYYIGYFDKKKSLQLGYVNGGTIGMQSSGKGIKGEITVAPAHKVGAFYIKSPYFFSNSRIETYGLHHKLNLENFSHTFRFARSHHHIAKMKTNIISYEPKFRIARKHHLSVTLAGSDRYHYLNQDSTYTKQGYLAGLGYTSYFVNNKWKFNIRGTYTSKGFGAYGFERLFLNHRSRIKLKKDFEIGLINNYNQYKYDENHYNYIPGYNENYFFFNSLNFYSTKYFPSIKPGIFYDIKKQWGTDFHVRGLNLSYNKYDITKNLQFSLITTLGLSKVMNISDSKNNFIYKLNTMIRYHNLSMNGFYIYGPLSPSMVYTKNQNNIMPQNLRISFMHQFVFPGKHLVLQSMVSYMYTNVYNHHSFNFNPELFYFTNSGWRFSINPSYTVYTSKLRATQVDLPSYITGTEFEFERHTNDNFLVSVGIRKDFGIPIPTTFKFYSDIDFVAFYDMNGNNIQDDNEPGIENVVIKTGNLDVITNSFGNSTLLNAEPGYYKYDILPLTDLKGWFPAVDDSLLIFDDATIYIPFVKGVKIFGSVSIEREIIEPGDEKPFDLSGIKITALNHKAYHTLTSSDGSFSFYLPFGEYIISLDETIMNGRYFIIKNNYELDLNEDIENMFITFHILEKKRKISVKKFSPDGTPEKE